MSADDEEAAREQSLINQTNIYGSTGLLRTSTAGSGAEGTFRVNFLMDWYSTSAFLCDPTNFTDGNRPITCSRQNREDDASHVGAFFTLNATPLEFLEGYASIRTYANSNSEGSPQLLQVLGDTTFGVKAFTPLRMLRPFAFGGELQMMLLNGTGDVGLAGGGTSAAIRALATADLRKPKGKGLPLRFNFNLGYKIDNSAEVIEDVEIERAKAFTDGRETQPISRIERFGLGINRVDFFQIHMGAELPFEKVQPYLEYSVDIPVNRQDYECHTNRVSRGDVCLGLDNFDDPNAGGIGYSGIPSHLSLGVRTTPFEKKFRGLGAHLALDIGLSGTSTFVEEIAPTPPWTLYLGLGYAFDTQEKAPPPPPPPPPARPVVQPKPQNFLRGFVHEQGKQQAVANAIISLEGSTEPPYATGADGRFLTRHLEPGNYTLSVQAEGFKPGTCAASITIALPPGAPAYGAPPAQPGQYGAQPAPGQFGQPGPFGQPGQPGQPGQFGPGQPGMPAQPQGDRFIDIDCPLEALPKKGAILGTVIDAANSSPVAAAVIRLEDAAGGSKSATADGSGSFKIVDLPPGVVTMRVEASGYMKSVASAEIRVNEDTRATLSLNKRPKRALVRVLGNEIKLKKKIHFETDSARIVGDSNVLLEEVADVLDRNKKIKLVEIQGHTDNTGTRAHNQELSQSRADAVRKWLVTAGVDASRLTAKGFGQDRPVAPNVTAANKSKNRRVQFIIKKK